MKKPIRHSAQRAFLRTCAVALSLTSLLCGTASENLVLALTTPPMSYAMADPEPEYGNATVCVTDANIRNAPGTSGTTVICALYRNTRVNCVEVVTLPSDPSNYLTWCKIEFLDSAGQVVTGYIVDSFLFKDADYTPDDAFEQEIANFPESYKLNLRVLHSRHPSWHFVPINIDQNFSDVVDAESRIGFSLIENSVNDSWKSVEPEAYNWETGEFVVYDGSNWVNASRGVVSYYMDPRNMLTDQYIFQFLELSYDPEHQKQEDVQVLLRGTFMESATIANGDNSGQIGYAEAFVQAAVTSGANPVFLAAKVLQEVSGNGSGSTSGNYYSEKYKKEYKDLYNFYNIGASSDQDPVAKGLAFARDGKTDSKGVPDTEYNNKLMLPWNTQYRSIVGGSIFIANAYIGQGQNTCYLMRFNVKPKDESQFGKHQYMTNIAGACSEGAKMHKAYESAGILDQNLYFSIPIYMNMPANPSAMPAANGNPNAYLKSLSVSNQVLTPSFDTVNCTEYSLVVPSSCTSVHIDAVPASPNAKVSGGGDIPLGEGVNSIAIVVTAQNGATRQYTLNIARNSDTFENYFTTDLAHSENFFGGVEPDTTVADLKARFTLADGCTMNYTNMNAQPKQDTDKVTSGDLIQILNAEGAPVYIAAIFIRGDANCDGKISAADLTLIARYILQEGTLNGAGTMGADANKDGKITAADLTLISKHILQEMTISQ